MDYPTEKSLQVRNHKSLQPAEWITEYLGPLVPSYHTGMGIMCYSSGLFSFEFVLSANVEYKIDLRTPSWVARLLRGRHAPILGDMHVRVRTGTRPARHPDRGAARPSRGAT